MNKAIFCIIDTPQRAANIVNQLNAAGISNNDISVLMPDKSGTRDFAHEHGTKAPEGAVTGAGAGGVLGGTLGLLAGIGALVIPGVGPFIAAGPIMAALSGAAVGAAVGGLAGTLVGLGIPEVQAKQYEGKIKGGNILLSVHSEDADTTKRVKEILERGGARDIATTGEASVKKKMSAE